MQSLLMRGELTGSNLFNRCNLAKDLNKLKSIVGQLVKIVA